ncbi:DUF302 domain-containing protein [Devosia algicola]|uniref:DUF302 domain-containing protein n=1 Tax=Devosia algicola TaxID=3026418 RepID=A0ABY7YRF1_9HYPH|nr:DUF302 domain-containing protein [Devosia algicola]WDR03905.1 DUF302 domain-containing protein [Devosia algicola]
MYTFNTTLIDTDFATAVTRTRDALAAEGFGVLTEIDVQKTMKAKLEADMPAYLILGACNPKMALEAIKIEPRVGAMLPCNVIVRQLDGNKIEVSAIDPVASMSAIKNAELQNVAGQVRDMLASVIKAI